MRPAHAGYRPGWTSGELQGRAAYLLFYAAAAAVMPQLTYYYRSVGLSGREVGLLAAIAPAVHMVGASLWSGLADATGRHRELLTAAMLGTVGVAQAFLFGASFTFFAVVALLFALFSSPIVPFIDNSVLEVLGARRDRYGRVRLWGAVGWGASAPLAGFLITRLGSGVVFPLYGLFMIACLAVVGRLPVHRNWIKTRFWQGLRAIARSREWVFFLSAVFCCGVGASFIHHYLFVYLGELGAGAQLRGFALAAATLSELVVFFFAHRLLRRFGAHRMLLVSLAATTLRLFLHYLIRVPELILIVQLLHGLSFSAFLVAGVTLARELAPEGMEVTAQGLFAAVNFGAAGIVGAYAGGELLDLVGVNAMYLVASAVTAVGLLVFIVLGRPFRGGTGNAEKAPDRPLR